MDKHIREKMQSKEFEVGPDQWASMNQLLDKQAAATTGSSAWNLTAWIAGGSIAAALTGWLLWQGLQQSADAEIAQPMARTTEQLQAPQQNGEQQGQIGFEKLIPAANNTTAEEVETEKASTMAEQVQPVAAHARRKQQDYTFGLPNSSPTPPRETKNEQQHQSNEGRYLSSQLHPFTEDAPEGPQPKLESQEVTPKKKPQAMKRLLANNELPGLESERLKKDRLHSVPFNYTQNNWSYGFKGGLSTTYRETGTSVSPLAAAFLTYSLGAKFSLQAEAAYRHLSYPADMQDPEQTIAADLYSPTALHFIELPLLIRYKVLPLHHINAGVRTSLVAHAQSTHPELNTFQEMGGQAVDLSLLLGYEFSLSEHVSMELRYNLGLNNLQAKAEEQRETFYAETAYANEASALLAFESDKQLVIPTMDNPETLEGIRVQRQLRNSDLQLSMYYRF